MPYRMSLLAVLTLGTSVRRPDARGHHRRFHPAPGRIHMNPENHGMDERALVLVVVKDGRFRLLAQ